LVNNKEKIKMTSRAELIENYKQKQKDLASAQEKNKAKILEKENSQVEF
jgi:hypothetical protein